MNRAGRPSGSRGDGRRVAVAFVHFALLLCAYYLIRPLRDALVAGLGSATIKYLSSAVFLASAGVAVVFAALVARVPRRGLIPGLYGVFALKLVGFAMLFRLFPTAPWVAAVFYVSVAVFNLVMVSTFWSFMADLWSGGGGAAAFGRIAAGGSVGGLVGPLLARSLAGTWGAPGLALAAAALLAASVLAAVTLLRGEDRERRLRFDEPLGGSAFAGLRDVFREPRLRRIAALLAGGSWIGMWVYIEVARAAAGLFPDTASRTAYFADRDLWVNAGALVLQFAVAPWVLRRWGPGAALTAVAVTVAAAFAGLILWPVAGVLLAINVLTRALEFGVAKPARDVLYTGVSEEARYKAKSVLDTAYARACDSLFGWLHAIVPALGASLALLGWVGVAVASAQSRVARGLPRGDGSRADH